MSGKDEDNATKRDEKKKLLFCMDKGNYLRVLLYTWQCNSVLIYQDFNIQ